jgi:hypothetical protein
MEMNLESFDERLGFAKMTGKAYVGGKVGSHERRCSSSSYCFQLS